MRRRSARARERGGSAPRARRLHDDAVLLLLCGCGLLGLLLCGRSLLGLLLLLLLVRGCWEVLVAVVELRDMQKRQRSVGVLLGASRLVVAAVLLRPVRVGAPVPLLAAVREPRRVLVAVHRPAGWQRLHRWRGAAAGCYGSASALPCVRIVRTDAARTARAGACS